MAVDKKYIEIHEDKIGRYEVIEVRIRDGKNCMLIPKDIPGIKTNCCPFCDTKTFSGSWAPETCPNCKAYYFMDAWIREMKQKESSYERN